MSNFLNKIPVSPITSFGNPSVPSGATFGTNFSILQTGGYMEVYSLSGLTYTIPPATTGIIEFSGNSIPIQFTKGSGSIFSPDVLTLNSDNISSGRRKLGMLVYVYETDKIYQYTIDNYETLWNNATGATGPGGPTVIISDFGTTIKNNSPEGVAFISAWTSSTISGVNGYDDTNASWRVLSIGGTSITGGTFNHGTETLTLNNSTGGTITITGFTDVYVTGGTYSSGTTTFTNSTGGTFTVSGYFTGQTDNYITGGTFNKNTEILSLYNSTGGTITITGFTDIFVTGGTYSEGTIIFKNNTGGTFNVTGLYTGTTDIFVTGGTYTNGTATFTNNSGGTFSVTGFYVPTPPGGKVILKKCDLGNRIIYDDISASLNLRNILLNTFLPFILADISNNFGTNIDFYASTTRNTGYRQKIFWGTILVDSNVFTNISTLFTTMVGYYYDIYNNGEQNPVNFYCEHYLNLTSTNYTPTQIRLTNSLFNSLNPFKYSKNGSYFGNTEFVRTNTIFNPGPGKYENINLKTISSDFNGGWVYYYDVSTSEDITKKIFDMVKVSDLFGNLSQSALTAILPIGSYDGSVREIIKNSVFVENLTSFYSKNKIPVNRNGFGLTSTNLLNNYFGELLYNIDGNPKNNPIYSNSNTIDYPSNTFYQYVDTYRILPTGVKKIIYNGSVPSETLLNNLVYNNLTVNEKYIKVRNRDYIQVLPGYKEVYILEIDVIGVPDTAGADEFLTWIGNYIVLNDKSSLSSFSNNSTSARQWLLSDTVFDNNPYGPYMVIQSNDDLMYELSINSSFTPSTSGEYIIKTIYKGYSFRPMIYPLNMNQITFEVPMNYLWNGNEAVEDENYGTNVFLTDNNININNKRLRFIVKYTKLQEYDIITSDLIITQQRSIRDNKFITLTINDSKGGESLEQTIYRNTPNRHRDKLRPGNVDIYLSLYDIITGETSLVPNYKIIITNYGDNEIFKLIKEEYVINNLFL